MMDAKITNGKLIITADLDEEGQLSKTGKTNLHVSTNGAKETPLKVNGKNLVVNLNAYTYVADKSAKKAA